MLSLKGIIIKISLILLFSCFILSTFIKKGDIVTSTAVTHSNSQTVYGDAVAIGNSGSSANNIKVNIRNSKNINSSVNNLALTNVLA